MDSYKAFRIEVADIENIWQLFTPFKYGEYNKQIYLRKIRRLRLACWVIHKLKTYKKPQVEAVEIIPDEDNIQTINTISTHSKPIFSLKIKCKIQINDWT